MRKLIVCAAMALTLGMAGLAQAGCTAEEAQQKAATFAQVVQAKAQQDPEGYAKVMQELQPERRAGSDASGNSSRSSRSRTLTRCARSTTRPSPN